MINLIIALFKRNFIATHFVRTDMINMTFTANEFNSLVSKGEVSALSWTKAYKVSKKTFITLNHSGKKTGLYLLGCC